MMPLQRIDVALQNIGLGVEAALAILIFFVVLIIATKDLRIGLLVSMLLYGAALILAYTLSLDTLIFAVGVLLSFAFLTLSLLIRKSETGVY